MLQAAKVNEQTIFQTMADHAPVMIWVTDPTGYCTYLNKQWLDFTGQTLEEAKGLGWTNAVHPDDKEAAGKTFMECSNERKAFNFDYRIRNKNGAVTKSVLPDDLMVAVYVGKFFFGLLV